MSIRTKAEALPSAVLADIDHVGVGRIDGHHDIVVALRELR